MNTVDEPKPLTMADFTDCIQEGPWYGEEGYIGDYLQPLEYPCNCSWCRGEECLQME